MENMELDKTKLIALSKLTTLINAIKRDDCYNYFMQISTSLDSRVYIGFCIIIGTDHRAIIHEEYDMCQKLDNTRIVSIEFLVEYIKNMNDIVYVGLKENSNSDEDISVCYVK